MRRVGEGREGKGRDVRDHFLEGFHGRVDVGAGGDVVFHFVDERRVGDAARVGGGIFAVGVVSVVIRTVALGLEGIRRSCWE